MTTQQARSSKSSPVTHVTTNTGRILRVNPAEAAAAAAATTSVAPVRTSTPMDPARRTDVLFRVRRDEGHELSPWWMIGAFLVSTGLIIALLSWVPVAS